MRARCLEVLLGAVLCAPVAAMAVEDVTCGQTLDSRPGNLTGDCSGTINIIDGTLYMQGFTISGTGLAAIQCHIRCRIEGPGTIISDGSTYGILGDGGIRLANVVISGHEAAGVDGGAVGRVRLDTVVVSGNGVGVSGPRLKLTDSEINDNSGSGVVVTDRGVKLQRTDVLRNGGDGVSVSLTSDAVNRATVLHSTVRDNGHFGVLAKSVSTKRAVIRANSQADACGDTEPCADIAAVNAPNVKVSACDTSMQVPAEFSGPIPFGVPWGVCDLD